MTKSSSKLISTDEVIFNILYFDCEKSKNVLYHYKKKYVKDRIVKNFPNLKKYKVEELSNIIFYRIFKYLKKFDYRRSNINTWINNIVDNKCRDIRKKHKEKKVKKLQYFDNYYLTKKISNKYYDNNTNSRFEVFDFIHNIVIHLISDIDYQIIMKKYYYQYSSKEIGDIFNLSETQVNNRISYIKKIIKNYENSTFS